jgi:hypothetical protein
VASAAPPALARSPSCSLPALAKAPAPALLACLISTVDASTCAGGQTTDCLTAENATFWK